MFLPSGFIAAVPIFYQHKLAVIPRSCGNRGGVTTALPLAGITLSTSCLRDYGVLVLLQGFLALLYVIAGCQKTTWKSIYSLSKRCLHRTCTAPNDKEPIDTQIHHRIYRCFGRVVHCSIISIDSTTTALTQEYLDDDN